MMILEPIAFVLFIALSVAFAVAVKNLLCRLIPPFKWLVERLGAIPDDELTRRIFVQNDKPLPVGRALQKNPRICYQQIQGNHE